MLETSIGVKDIPDTEKKTVICKENCGWRLDLVPAHADRP